MVKSALTCFDSKEETDILVLLLLLLGTRGGTLAEDSRALLESQ